MLTVLLLALNSFQVWKNGKPSQLKCGDTKVCDLFLDWMEVVLKRNGRASVSAEKGQNEAAEKKQRRLEAPKWKTKHSE